jgi:hypothetical protein
MNLRAMLSTLDGYRWRYFVHRPIHSIVRGKKSALTVKFSFQIMAPFAPVEVIVVKDGVTSATLTCSLTSATQCGLQQDYETGKMKGKGEKTFTGLR